MKTDRLPWLLSRFPSNYLPGSSTRASYKCTSSWNTVVNRIQKRLTGWKDNHLSKGGKMVLIKSVMSNLPTYFLPLFVIPALVEKKNRVVSM